MTCRKAQFQENLQFKVMAEKALTIIQKPEEEECQFSIFNRLNSLLEISYKLQEHKLLTPALIK